MKQAHERLAQVMLQQLGNADIKLDTKKAKEAEYFMLIGYLAMQAELDASPDAYLILLAQSGRQLTEEYKRADVVLQ